MSKTIIRYFRVVEPTGGYELVTDATLRDVEGWTRDANAVCEDFRAAVAMGFKPYLDVKTIEEERFRFDVAQTMVREDGLYWPDESEVPHA